MLNNIVMYTGCFFITVVSFLIAAWAYSIIQGRREGYRERQYYKAMKEARIDLGRRMINDAYWLTGNHEAFKTYHFIGYTLLKEGGIDISRFRDELVRYEVK